MGTEQEGARERCEAFQLGVYRHYKGGEYVAFVTSLDEASGEPFVHYYSLSFKKRWTRFMSVFSSRCQHEGPRLEPCRSVSGSCERPRRSSC
jgi:hypothetical protein